MVHNSSDGVDCAVTIRTDADSSDAIGFHIVNHCMVFANNFVVEMVLNSNSVFDRHHHPKYSHSLTYSLCMDTSAVNSTV